MPQHPRGLLAGLTAAAILAAHITPVAGRRLVIARKDLPEVLGLGLLDYTPL